MAAAADWGTYVCTHTYTAAGINRALDCGVRCIEHGQLADEDAVRHMADKGAWWSLQPFLQDEDANPKSDPGQQAAQLQVSAGTERAVEMARKHNVKVALGTDILFAPTGTASQGRQLAKFARWYESVDVLRMLTSGNADLVALSGPRNPYPAKLGRIEAGAYADMILIDGNPIEDIALIGTPETSIKLVVKDGRIHKNALSP